MVAKLIPLAIFVICAIFLITGFAAGEEPPTTCAPARVYLTPGDRLIPDGTGGFVVEKNSGFSTSVDILLSTNQKVTEER